MTEPTTEIDELTSLIASGLHWQPRILAQRILDAGFTRRTDDGEAAS